MLAKITKVQRFSSDAKLWSKKVEKFSKFVEGQFRWFLKLMNDSDLFSDEIHQNWNFHK